MFNSENSYRYINIIYIMQQSMLNNISYAQHEEISEGEDIKPTFTRQRGFEERENNKGL